MHNSVDVWALIDERTGHTSQVLGVAAKLGLPYSIKKISYSWLATLPNHLVGKSGLSISTECKEQLCAPWPKIVIAAGRRMAPVARYIKARSPDTILVQLMWPGEPADDFSIIAVPQHDDVPDHHPAIIRTKTALHAVTKERLSVAKEQWHPVFNSLPSPRFALLIGGSSKHGNFAQEDYVELCRRANMLSKEGSLLVTTSRRSHKYIDRILGEHIHVPSYIHCYDDKQENPYFGMLACADFIITTGDSISMCSEACVTGKPLYIYLPEHFQSDKLKRFMHTLFDAGHAKSLLKDHPAGTYWEPPQAIDDAQKIADSIVHYL